MRPKQKGRLKVSGQLWLATWNMSYLNPTQLQFLDLLGHDIVFLTEVHNTAVPLADYGGVHRLLPSGTPPAGQTRQLSMAPLEN